MAEGHLAEQKITEGVGPVELRHLEGVHDVALGLAHLLAVDRPPAVGDDRDGGLQPQGQEHERPDDAVEADDVLAHHVPDGRPVFPEHRGIVQIPHRRGVIDQGVEPDVNHVLLVARDRDAPLEGRTGHGLIPNLPPQEAHDLVVADARHDPAQVLFVMFDQPGDVFGGSEKVAFLLHQGQGPAAVRAGVALPGAGLGDVGLAGDAVLPLVGPLVDVPLVHQFPEHGLDHADMARLGGADEVVVADIQDLPQILEVDVDLVHQLLGRHPLRLRGGLDLLPVLVRPCEEIHVVPLHALVTAHDVAGYRRVGVADVGDVVDVIDGSGDVEIPAVHNKKPPYSRTRTVRPGRVPRPVGPSRA